MLRQAFRSPLTAALRASSISGPTPFTRIARVHPAFVRLLSQDARAQIQKAVNAHPLVLFMKGTPEEPQCGFSRAVIQILGIHGVPADKMKAYNVLEDAELRSGIKEFSEWPTIPQVYVGGEFVGGCDIVISMHQSGELEELLEKHEIIPKMEDDPQPTSQTSTSS